jgi:ankyrin repeat protein
MLKSLLDRGALPTPDRLGLIPLVTAIRLQRISVIDFFLTTDPDSHKWQHNGMTVVHFAARYGLHKIVPKLLAAFADLDVNAVDSFGMTPLHYAIQEGHGKFVKTLVKISSLDFGIKNPAGDLPLFAAAKRGIVDCLKPLFQADIAHRQATDAGGGTVLHAAARSGRVLAVSFLLEEGFDREVVDGEGKKASEVAGGLKPVELGQLIAEWDYSKRRKTACEVC